MIYTCESDQVDGSSTTAVSRRIEESNSSEKFCVTEDEAITLSDSAVTEDEAINLSDSVDGLSQNVSTYIVCRYHLIRKYSIDHYCKDHGCCVCKKCARKRGHRHCDIVGIKPCIQQGLNVNVERKRHGYQICQYHENNNSLIDHFCKDHSCLLCLTCARRKHSKCTILSVITLSRVLNLKEEVNQFLSSIVYNLKVTLLLLKEKLERHMKVDLENEHQKTYNEAVHWFQSNTRKDADAERVLDHITADLSWALKNEKRNLADHIKKIDDILKNFNNTYMKLESSETAYNNDSEKLFISVYNLVPDINNCVKHLQQLQQDKKLYFAHLKLLLCNKTRAIKIEKEPLQKKPVECFSFPKS